MDTIYPEDYSANEIHSAVEYGHPIPSYYVDVDEYDKLLKAYKELEQEIKKKLGEQNNG